MENRIRIAIEKVVVKLWPEKKVSFVVEHPAEEKFGDYSTNVAMVMGENPRDAVSAIRTELEKDKDLLKVVERMEIAGAGFLNFRLKRKWLLGELLRVNSEKSDYGKGEWFKGKKVLVEYSSPNIAKEFSVGHLRSTIIGQALYNLYQFGGALVVGDNHWGDWGTQFGMIIAAVEDKKIELEQFMHLGIDELEKIYVEFNARAKDDPTLIEKAREAFARLEQGEEKARAIWQASVSLSIKEFEKIYELLEVKIDNAFGESHYEKLMPTVIEEAKKMGVAKESQGALIIEYPDGGKKEEMPPAMLLKSNKTTTYFTRDLATIKFRESEEKLKSDLYIYEVGAEQSLHFRQVFAAAEKLWGVKRGKFKHVAHGLVLGNDGKKMSTRKGTGVRMEELLTKMIENAGKINAESAKEVGVGAVKFFDLKHKPETSYRFDWKEALRLDGDSGPYVQYAVVRARSLVEKAGGLKESLPITVKMVECEEAIVRWIYRFPEVIEDSAKSFSPNILVEFLLELAKRFNAFYNKEQVIGSDNEAFRLVLTAGVAQVLENGLKILGIEVPEKM